MRWLLGAACSALLLAAPAASRTSGAVLDRFDLVGHVAFAGGIESADVWAHGAYAYVGSSCGSERRGGGGVRIVDISRPSHPRLVARLGNDAFTRAEDVVVRHIRTSAFDGDLAVVGIQACLGSGQEHIVKTGLRFFDVTHPRHPELIGTWLLPPGAIGCHEVDLAQRPDGHLLAGCARQLQDQVEGSTNTELPGGVQIVDATDPAHPVSRAAWQLPLDSTIGIGCLPIRFAHSIRFVNGGLGA